MYKARKALGDLVDPAVEHSQRAGVARGGSLKNRTPVGRVQPGRLGAADQRCCGGVALIAADGPAGAGHAVQRVQPEMPQLAAKAACALQKTSAGQDAAADAGAQRHTDDIGTALSRTGPDLAQQHTVGVVGDGDGQTKGTLQRTFNVHADPPREIAAGPRDHAAAAVDLARGGHSDSLEPRRVRGQKFVDGRLHGIQDRRFVAVKADAALGAAQHPAVLIDEPQLDRRAADVNAQIGFTHSTPAYLWLLMAAV